MITSWLMKCCKFAKSSLEVKLIEMKPLFVQAAQKIYDSWNQNDSGEDIELGEGGICSEISNAFGNIIASKIPNVEIEEYGFDGDDHSSVLVVSNSEKFVIDIPPYVYESGGGYRWKKKPNIVFLEDHVFIEKL